ncbi:LOW QUALITY PROTEIN: protein TNT, partial [Marmota monax]|uniref:LOW QUALITY PROTEIN: protein TNT n=1 Tax=Marmota monax TaxID=9995 RepID=UPI001EB044AC
PDRPQTTLRGLQGPLLLDKPIPLPPAFPKKEGGGSPAWNACEPEPSVQSHSLELRALPASHAEEAPEPLSVTGSTLGKPPSSKALVQSMPRPQQDECSNASLLSSGYTGDTEDSDVRLAAGNRVALLSKRPHSQAGTTHAPSPVNSRLSGHGHGTRQAGGEK